MYRVCSAPQSLFLLLRCASGAWFNASQWLPSCIENVFGFFRSHFLIVDYLRDGPILFTIALKASPLRYQRSFNYLFNSYILGQEMGIFPNMWGGYTFIFLCSYSLLPRNCIEEGWVNPAWALSPYKHLISSSKGLIAGETSSWRWASIATFPLLCSALLNQLNWLFCYQLLSTFLWYPLCADGILASNQTSVTLLNPFSGKWKDVIGRSFVGGELLFYYWL